MTLLTSVRCARLREVLGPVTAFAPTILVPGIRPRSTRWRVDEKVAAFFCPQPWAATVLGMGTRSKAERGGTSGKGHQPPGYSKCKCLCKATFSKGPLGHTGCSPQIREQFANLASSGLAFLIGLGLEGSHLSWLERTGGGELGWDGGGRI